MLILNLLESVQNNGQIASGILIDHLALLHST